jgi:predicted nucleic acid-binding protein
MTKIFTVYFDTQFYVRLANTDETLASKTIDKLNNLQVRHVLSQTIVFELLKKSTKPEKDKILGEIFS